MYEKVKKYYLDDEMRIQIIHGWIVTQQIWIMHIQLC